MIKNNVLCLLTISKFQDILQSSSPDGISQIHSKVTENNTLKEDSHSEFWSSFSSSEEKLLECEGLLLSLPLAPHRKCLPPKEHPDYEAASHQNTVSYKYGFSINKIYF